MADDSPATKPAPPQLNPLQQLAALVTTGVSMVQSALREEENKQAQQQNAQMLNAAFGGQLFPTDPKTGQIKASGKPEQQAIQVLAQAGGQGGAPVVAAQPASLAPQNPPAPGAREGSQQPLQGPVAPPPDPAQVRGLQQRDAAIRRAQDQRATMEALRGNIQVPLPPGVTVRARFGPGGTTHEVVAETPETGVTFASEVGKMFGDAQRAFDSGDPATGYALMVAARRKAFGDSTSAISSPLGKMIQDAIIYHEQGNEEAAALMQQAIKAELLTESKTPMTPEQIEEQMKAVFRALESGASPEVAETGIIGSRLTDQYVIGSMQFDAETGLEGYSLRQVPVGEAVNKQNQEFLANGHSARLSGMKGYEYLARVRADPNLPAPLNDQIVDDLFGPEFRENEYRARAQLAKLGIQGAELDFLAAQQAFDVVGGASREQLRKLETEPPEFGALTNGLVVLATGKQDPRSWSAEDLQKAATLGREMGALDVRADTAAKILTEQQYELLPAPLAEALGVTPLQSQSELLQTHRGISQFAPGAPTSPDLGELPLALSQSDQNQLTEFTNALTGFNEIKMLVKKVFAPVVPIGGTSFPGRLAKGAAQGATHLIGGTQKTLTEEYEAASLSLIKVMRRAAFPGNMSDAEREFLLTKAIPKLSGPAPDSLETALAKVNHALGLIRREAREFVDLVGQPQTRTGLIERLDLFTPAERNALGISE